MSPVSRQHWTLHHLKSRVPTRASTAAFFAPLHSTVVCRTLSSYTHALRVALTHDGPLNTTTSPSDACLALPTLETLETVT